MSGTLHGTNFLLTQPEPCCFDIPLMEPLHRACIEARARAIGGQIPVKLQTMKKVKKSQNKSD